MIVLRTGNNCRTNIVRSNGHDHLNCCQYEQDGKLGEAQFCRTDGQGQHFQNSLIRAFRLTEQHSADYQRRRNHKPNHTHKSLNEEVIFGSDRDTPQIKIHIGIDNTRNPHHNDWISNINKILERRIFF